MEQTSEFPFHNLENKGMSQSDAADVPIVSAEGSLGPQMKSEPEVINITEGIDGWELIERSVKNDVLRSAGDQYGVCDDKRPCDGCNCVSSRIDKLSRPRHNCNLNRESNQEHDASSGVIDINALSPSSSGDIAHTRLGPLDATLLLDNGDRAGNTSSRLAGDYLGSSRYYKNYENHIRLPEACEQCHAHLGDAELILCMACTYQYQRAAALHKEEYLYNARRSSY